MGRLIAEKYKEWEQECSDRFHQLKANEEELNRIFIDIYGLQDELTPEVEDKDVTVRKAHPRSRGQGRDRPQGGFAARNQIPDFLRGGLYVRSVFARCGWVGLCWRRLGFFQIRHVPAG